MKIVIALAPVLFFLLFLIYLDSFKLVKIRTVLSAIYWGVASCAICYFVNTELIVLSGMKIGQYSTYVSPVVEEIVKASFLILLMKTKRVGFMIDGAILGFAIGAGFGVLENVYYLYSVKQGSMLLWTVRGFGTAIMHGGATAIVAIFSMSQIIKDENIWKKMFSGLVMAAFVHGLFNSFMSSPIVSVLIMLLAFPLTIMILFQRNEAHVREWMEDEFDNESDLLQAMNSGTFQETHAGKYLNSIKHRFDNEVVFDMVCYIRNFLELSIRAKGMMLLKESGLPVKKDPSLIDKLKELEFLKKNIGKTGLLAISPIISPDQKHVWQLKMLED